VNVGVASDDGHNLLDAELNGFLNYEVELLTFQQCEA